MTVVDFGQNLVGRLRLTTEGEAGDEVVLRHAEILEDGELCTAPLNEAQATDRYTLAGDGPETWSPRFTFHGFRYAEVTGPWDSLTAEVCHSDLRPRPSPRPTPTAPVTIVVAPVPGTVLEETRPAGRAAPGVQGQPDLGSSGDAEDDPEIVRADEEDVPEEQLLGVERALGPFGLLQEDDPDREADGEEDGHRDVRPESTAPAERADRHGGDRCERNRDEEGGLKADEHPERDPAEGRVGKAVSEIGEAAGRDEDPVAPPDTGIHDSAGRDRSASLLV